MADLTSPDPQPAVQSPGPANPGLALFGNDAPLWYQGAIEPPTRWADAGYAVVNTVGKDFSINKPILELFSLVGRNLQVIAHEPDARLSRPPNVGILWKVHQLVVRSRQILSARALPANQVRFDPMHAQPAPEVFRVWPIPYFGARVRQPAIAEWLGYGLAMLSEMAQHTDNDYAYDITTDFAAVMSQYLQRIYFLEAITFFGKDRATAMKPDFTLADSDFTAYDPSKWFTSVEMTDERLDLGWQPNTNDMKSIRNLAANELIGCCQYPGRDMPVLGGAPTAKSPEIVVPATGAFLPLPGAAPVAK